MCSGELAAEAATAAAAARLRWRREAGWDPRFLLVIKFNAYKLDATRTYSGALIREVNMIAKAIEQTVKTERSSRVFVCVRVAGYPLPTG